MSQGVVIQGPTGYCHEVAPLYRGIANVVWSTWEDEPQENITFIQQYMPVVLNEEPSFPGYLNVNMQTVSTLGGIKFLEERGVTEILKVRGDLKILELSKLLEILQGRTVSFLAKAKENARKDLYYELEYAHYSHDYPVDLVIYGKTKILLGMFGFVIDDFLPIPPEALISYAYMTSIGAPFSLSDSKFTETVTYFLQDCLDSNIDIHWIKHNGDLVRSHMNRENYVY